MPPLISSHPVFCVCLVKSRHDTSEGEGMLSCAPGGLLAGARVVRPLCFTDLEHVGR